MVLARLVVAILPRFYRTGMDLPDHSEFWHRPETVYILSQSIVLPATASAMANVLTMSGLRI